MLDASWDVFAHPHQLPPDRTAQGLDWTTWPPLGGRGAGKTRAGAEWVRNLACHDPQARIALVGETEHDVRAVMVEGVSGLRMCIRNGSGRDGCRRAAASNGRTARWRRSSRRKITRACAGRNFPPPGAMSSPSGVMPKQPLTCCSSDCALASGRGR